MVEDKFWWGLIAVFASYLLGSIPTGYLMGKFLKKIDIRQHGSGNLGATNVFRVLGKSPGILTLMIDVGKGLVAVLLGSNNTHLQLVCGIAAILGHNWTCFLKFKGGKGVATSAGVFLGLAPLVTLCLVAIWGVVAFLTRFVSVASIVASMSLPVFLFVFEKPLEWIIAGFGLSWILILKHRENIKRLLNGTENKIGKKQIDN